MSQLSIDMIRQKNRIAALKRNQKYRKEVRKRQQVYICDHPNCGRVFKNWGNLVTHERTHLPRQMIVCSICQKKLKSESALKTHMTVP